jgi:hypothetical protein
MLGGGFGNPVVEDALIGGMIGGPVGALVGAEIGMIDEMAFGGFGGMW